MARSIAAEQDSAFRAVITARDRYGARAERTWYEGIYNKKAQATGRVTFWRRWYARVDPDAFVSGTVERASITWEPVE